LVGGITILYLMSFLRGGLRYFSLVMGVLSLIALVLFVNRTPTPLGIGGMERLIVYPQLIWTIAFGFDLFLKRNKEYQ